MAITIGCQQFRWGAREGKGNAWGEGCPYFSKTRWDRNWNWALPATLRLRGRLCFGWIRRIKSRSPFVWNLLQVCMYSSASKVNTQNTRVKNQSPVALVSVLKSTVDHCSWVCGHFAAVPDQYGPRSAAVIREACGRHADPEKARLRHGRYGKLSTRL